MNYDMSITPPGGRSLDNQVNKLYCDWDSRLSVLETLCYICFFNFYFSIVHLKKKKDFMIFTPFLVFLRRVPVRQPAAWLTLNCPCLLLQPRRFHSVVCWNVSGHFRLIWGSQRATEKQESNKVNLRIVRFGFRVWDGCYYQRCCSSAVKAGSLFSR